MRMINTCSASGSLLCEVVVGVAYHIHQDFLHLHSIVVEKQISPFYVLVDEHDNVEVDVDVDDVDVDEDDEPVSSSTALRSRSNSRAVITPDPKQSSA